MDAHRFDALARSLSASGSRRRALSVVVGSALGLVGLTGAAAKKKKPCPPCKTRKKGTCKGTLPDGAACVGGTCRGGSCVTSPPPPGCTPDCSGKRCGDGDGCGGTCTAQQGCGPNETCVGGACQSGVACTTQSDCGGYGSNDLVCKNGRCACDTEGEGICQRFADGRGTCHVCCPGGNQQCVRDQVCHYVEGPSGNYGYCGCPTGWKECQGGHPGGTCVGDPMTDNRKCGTGCIDCTRNGAKAICCGGVCIGGCPPGQNCFDQGGPCGPNCLPCGNDAICCNQGPGTPPQCIPDIHGGFCYFMNA